MKNRPVFTKNGRAFHADASKMVHYFELLPAMPKLSTMSSNLSFAMTRSILVLCLMACVTGLTDAQTLYSKAFGSPGSKPVVFLHGGPGYNCAAFEASTAQKMADNGFYVIVYDRRGEGRSTDKAARFTFEQTFADLDNLYQQYGLTKATLMGHSFGGIVATLYAEKKPKHVNAVVLVSAPISLQESLTHILHTCKAIYESKKDSVNRQYIGMLEKMDSSSLEYASYLLGHAMLNKFYSPKAPTEEANALYAANKTDTVYKKYASAMTYQAPQGFWKNEHYTTIDITPGLKNLVSHKVRVYGLYGKDDGLYSPEQITKLTTLLGASNVKYLDNCSHNVFIDQQATFVQALQNWAK